MEQDKLTLFAEKGTSLSSGSLRLYALPYGCIDLYAYDPLNRRAAVGIMVATEYRRQGYALAMLEKLEALFSPEDRERRAELEIPNSGSSPNSSLLIPHSSLHQLYADIAATNTASLALFRKAGYSECGRFHDWLLVGDRYVDSIRMQKILS